MSSIYFFSEDIDFKLKEPKAVKTWLTQVAHKEGGITIEELSYIFCSDAYLHTLNVEFLEHDTFTDILTFDHRDDISEEIMGEIYISIDRVRENAHSHSESFSDELSRVMVHGLLHLLGYSDITDEQKQAMRKKEDACLSLR